MPIIQTRSKFNPGKQMISCNTAMLSQTRNRSLGHLLHSFSRILEATAWASTGMRTPMTVKADSLAIDAFRRYQLLRDKGATSFSRPQTVSSTHPSSGVQKTQTYNT